MNIKIVDSWLREHLKTKATPKTIAEKLSLSAVSVEKIEKIGQETVYDIEITSNRPDLMSVIGIAREAAAILPQFEIDADFLPLKTAKPKEGEKLPLKIEYDRKIVNRICAVLMEVSIKDSPSEIKERLEASGIRSLNNLIDITNYVMKEIGHPTHVFDYDRLNTDTLIIRESKKGEKIVTLDKKEYILAGGDIVADNGKGEIVDLLGVMGTANSVVTEKTKRILFFIDNNEPYHMRKTSMGLGIRTEAAILNEKGVDPQLSMEALLRGIDLYEKIGSGKVVSKILDIYPNKPLTRTIEINKDKFNKIIGVEIPVKNMVKTFSDLGFKTEIAGNKIKAVVPSWRINDVELEEDLIEEVARVYGYHHLPSVLPPLIKADDFHLGQREFYWEKRAREALKYWGFTEIYTYSFVSENLLEGPVRDAVELANPLSDDMVYMRKTLIPSLLEALHENKSRTEIKIFEIANVYLKKEKNLPDEVLTIAGVIKRKNLSFFEIKGYVEQLLNDFGIEELRLKQSEKGGLGASVYLDKNYLGEIEMFDDETGDFELNFEELIKHASLKKVYSPISKFPPVFEDLAIVAQEKIQTGNLIGSIKEQSPLITEVSLLDQFEKTRTFHIVYQSFQKNLEGDEIAKIREKILKILEEKFSAKIRS